MAVIYLFTEGADGAIVLCYMIICSANSQESSEAVR